MGSEMLVTWGSERTRRVNLLGEWLAAGATLAAGTDMARPFNPMTNVRGMATRGTKSAGIRGPEHAIDVADALRLYTLGTAELIGEADRLGSITPSKLADLVAYRSTRSVEPAVNPSPLIAVSYCGGRFRGRRQQEATAAGSAPR
jgi:predicted amidohydrolase YtcJ